MVFRQVTEGSVIVSYDRLKLVFSCDSELKRATKDKVDTNEIHLLRIHLC